MPTYIALMNWTDQGIRSAKDTVHRRDQADALAQKYGASIEQVYWTVGPYDLVSILQAPDEESATAMVLELGSAGNLRTLTLRAYDREEMSGIIQRLG
ncbi:MAG: GYD domain-containing protein [Actinomycetota bacterium]|nr:GYD domain-containing protein [Actinomycetota bacterium]